MVKTRIFSAIGVIVLGALGSGLWEFLKPVLGWFGTWILTLSTLGMDSLRDTIYAAAHTPPMLSEIKAATATICSVVMLTGTMVLTYIRVSFRPRQPRFATTHLVFLLGLGIAFFAASLRHIYSAGLSAYSSKLETIAAQHISDTELKQVRARAAQVNSRSSYLDHVEGLRQIAESNGETVQPREFF